ncbi:NADPH-dependent FMN reductase [Flavobacterium restrictum]|uniref:NAD(P)H-dependent oxidoreductase n=1 Tax=Flavobacterium restrictum TaxID=2594428 RepID=A0A553EDR8_9FLAO|nr:NAD(P)H-dependent oxidoreductase [Flavobacterium restrictum]TRX43145.1 NAD(P)H-dependent oxidoreductase [Flavobacterium restrictum]
MHISILSSSIRTGRKSHNIALYFQHFLNENRLATVEILDLASYNFPLFESPLKYQPNPSRIALEFKSKIVASDGIIIVTPEYNGSIPASLKNAIDLLYEEWQGKPIAFSTASSGDFGGLQAITHLQFIFWKIGALCVSKNFPVSKVQEKFDEFGLPIDPQEMDEFAQIFIDNFLKCVEVSQK